MVEIRHILIGLIIIIAGMAVALYFQSVKYADLIEEQIDLREKEIERREENIRTLQDMILVYSEEIKWMNGQIVQKQIAIDSLKKLRNEIPTIVNDMPVSELDSILSNYRHPGE